MSTGFPKVTKRWEDKELKTPSSTIKRSPKRIKWILPLLLFCTLSAWFVGGWGNLSKADKEKLYEELVMRELDGSLNEDSVAILCQLAKELKKEIPDICDKRPAHAKTSGKNGKYSNKKKKETACERMRMSRQKLDSLKRVPNKTPAIKKELEKTKNEYRRDKQKCEDTGEDHSQKAKR